MKDLIIIGAGPAGLTAGLYAARKEMNALILTKEFGGQPMWTSGVENYMGFQMITGPELMMKFKLTTDALPRVYQIGDKIGQLVVVPYYKATPVFVEELSSTDRGENGYGSTDKKEKSGTDLILETKELAKNEHNTGESTTGNSEVSGDNR